jgi:preprotein translocase subunit YajC
MLRERIVWIVALLVIAGAGFYSGQIIGGRAAAADRAQAAQGFFSQRGGGQAGGQGGGQAGGGFRGGGAAGTVSEVSGDTITITTRNGQTMKVQLAADSTVRKQVDGQLSDITVGTQVVAMGTQNGDTFQATSIQIGGFGGGPGGSGGLNPQATPTK